MQKQVGYILLVMVLGLLALGTVMLFSTSAKFAPEHSSEMYYYVHRQVCWLLLGGIVCVLLSRTDYHWLIRHAPWGVALAIFLLLLVFVPGLGRKVKGSVRWIQLIGFTFQPSEFAKIALVLFLSYWMTKHQRHTENFVKGFLAPGAVLVVMAALVLRQGDLGMTA